MKKAVDDFLYTEIKRIIEQARATAYRTVNFTMVLSYWEIGKRIVEKEQQGKSKSVYGAALLNELSSRLTAEFGKGYSETNLKYFRQFYLTFRTSGNSHSTSDEFPAGQKSHALRDELTWTHYRL